MRQATSRAIRVKRAYETPAVNDGTRVLVDRLWPRGLRKQDAAIDHWLKEIAPSTELRQWFHHDPSRWDEFRRRYRGELSRNWALLDELRAIGRQGPLTLIYAARDTTHNHAIELRDAIERRGQFSSSKKRAKMDGRSGAARMGRSNRQVHSK